MQDVIVVGGGPAGSAVALRLARLGYEVLLLDRAHFPRPKPCAEYISPGAVREFIELGAWPPFDPGDTQQASMEPWLTGSLPQLRGFRMYPDQANSFTCDFNGLPGEPKVLGTAVPRLRLDNFFLKCARQAGVEVREGVQVRDILYDPRQPQRVVGVVATQAGQTYNLLSRLVVGADGLRSIVGRRLGVLRRHGPKRVALVAHYAGIRDLTDFGEMHIMEGGYCGIAPLGGGLANIAVVLFEERAANIHGQVEMTLENTLRAAPGLRERLERAELATPVLTTGPFAQSAHRAAMDGALLVGDAADFYDPFTGQGMYAALRGARLAAQVAHRALREGGVIGRLDGYDRLRRREFLGKWLVERLIQRFITRRGLMNRAAPNLARHPDLATMLVRVTGDVSPAWQVLRLDYLARVLL